MLSFLGRLNYNYKSLYYATVSFRSTVLQIPW